MLFHDYLDSIQGTEDEARFLAHLEKSHKGISKVANMPIPVAGKIMKALAHLGECDSVEDFKESCHYNSVRNWEIKIDLDKSTLSCNPSKELQAKWLGIAAAIVSAAITAIVLAVLFKRK